MRISDWSSDVCSSDLRDQDDDEERQHHAELVEIGIASQAEQGGEDELHPAGQDDADDQEQDRGAKQMADERERAKGQRRDRPNRLLAREAGEVADRAAELAGKIGRGSCRERVCQYVYIQVGAGYLKKQTTKNTTYTTNKHK